MAKTILELYEEQKAGGWEEGKPAAALVDANKDKDKTLYSVGIDFSGTNWWGGKWFGEGDEDCTEYGDGVWDERWGRAGVCGKAEWRGVWATGVVGGYSGEGWWSSAAGVGWGIEDSDGYFDW